MSIVTKTGDSGTTALMYGRRVPKNHPRVEAYGTVDELNTALGLARATAAERFISDNLRAIQKDLVTLMGELCVQPSDLARYLNDGFVAVTPAMTAKLEVVIKEIEGQNVSLKGWATPGATPAAATLDLARATCRRAERRVCDLPPAKEPVNPEIVVYLNRLSDLLWLMARWTETRAGTAPA